MHNLFITPPQKKKYSEKEKKINIKTILTQVTDLWKKKRASSYTLNSNIA